MMVAPGTNNKVNETDGSTNTDSNQKALKSARSMGPSSRDDKVSLNADPRDLKRGRSVAYDMKQRKFDLNAYYNTAGVARGFMMAPDVSGAYKQSKSLMKSEKKG